MFWLLVLPSALLGVGVIVFVLTRDSFRAPGARRKAAASSTEKSSDAMAINAMMQEKLSTSSPSHPAMLLSGQDSKEADTLADTLAQVKENPILPSAPKVYLRLEERDDSLDRLFARRIPGQGEAGSPPREFSIGVTEKKEAPLEREKEMFPSGIGQTDKEA